MLELKTFFSVYGRIGRKQYFTDFCILLVAIIIIVFLVYHYLLGLHGTPQGVLGYVIKFIITTLILPVTIKRTHDLGHPWYISLFMYINFIAGIYVLFLLLIRGDKGPNKYGPDPLEKLPTKN